MAKPPKRLIINFKNYHILTFFSNFNQNLFINNQNISLHNYISKMIEKGENGSSPPKNDLYENLKKLSTRFFSSSNFNQNLGVNNENYF